MNDYLTGCAILGAEPPMYGPGPSGTVYTDTATIMAVQKKLEQLGYFHGVVDGKYGAVTNAAIKNYSGKDGPPDDELLKKLGLSKDVAFSDEEVDQMVVQAKTASTPAQVQVVAAKIEKLVENASPEVKAEAAAVKQEAALAKTPEQLAAVKGKIEAVAKKAKKGMPVWQIALIASGGAVLLGLMAYLGFHKKHVVRSSS